MISLVKGRYSARQATSAEDLDRVQRLRGLAFARPSFVDADQFDALCDHVLVEERETGVLVCCFRFLPLPHGRDIGRSYAAQYYGLTLLKAFQGRLVELGRFCVHPDYGDPDILRIAWGAMTAYVDATQVELLFGCVSFNGTDPAAYFDAFGVLQDRHIAPQQFFPQIKAPKIVSFARDVPVKPNAKRANHQMPPLLRTYLLMGGWVSDHAVVDCDMNTLHVFTGVEIAAIPDARKRLLRAVAASR